METKILKVVFGGRKYTTTAKRTRTDYGQMFEFVDIALPDTFEVIFSNSSTSAGTGKKMIGSQQRVLIPDEYLQTGQTIYAWILLHDTEDDGRHMYSIKSPVDDMPDTSPEEPTPVEQSIISQAITALNSAVDTTTQKAQEATESADRAEHAAEGVEGYAERAEAAQSASESARDIALEAKVSAQASAATASEKASEAISSATTASQSAMTAETASESARASATASAESASQASQSADTASGKASDASEYASNANTSAQTASQKASEAAQSASTAVQAKTDAITAKAASETAQGLAESARDGAVSAKTGAESARDEAQEIVDGITGKVEQIDSNTDRIESLEDDRYKPYATDAASGAVASFPDGADGIPLKSCIVRVEPVQDLHGYDSPWPAGGGKNKINVPDVTLSGNSYIFNLTNLSIPAGTYTFSMKTAAVTTPSFAVAGINGDYLNQSIPNSFTFTVDGEITGIRCYSSAGTYSKIMLEAGSTKTSYVPYENICPITGWAGCVISHSGADMTNPTTYPITFPSETGTIYGAYVDVVNGKLVVDRAEIASYNGETLPSTWISDRDVYASGTTPTIGAQVVYKLAEPIHYPLEATEIRSLLGQNNIWADTGDTSVTYRADTTLYISRLTEPDADMIADANITSGSYFMVGNNLYRATANIASGANVIVGTNATKVSLAQALNEINA